jgi:hypothetical protein
MNAQSLQPRLIDSILAVAFYLLYNPAIQIAVARMLS